MSPATSATSATPHPCPTQPFDGVCHLAGLAQVRESRTDPLRYWQTNTGGMLALLDWLPKAGADRLVIASTCAVYGEPDQQPIAETAPETPTNPYGSSKLAADRAAADCAASGELGAISLRAFNITGAIPGRPDHDLTRLIPKLLAVQHGHAPEITINGDGSAIRDFVHVADMADAFARALTACQPGTWRAYNVGSGQPRSIADVIRTVETVTGRPVPRRHATARTRARLPRRRHHPHPQRTRLATHLLHPRTDHHRRSLGGRGA